MIPPSLATNENGTYAPGAVTATSIEFTGTSAQYTEDSVTGTYGPDGKLAGGFTFSGPNFGAS